MSAAPTETSVALLSIIGAGYHGPQGLRPGGNGDRRQGFDCVACGMDSILLIQAAKQLKADVEALL